MMMNVGRDTIRILFFLLVLSAAQTGRADLDIPSGYYGALRVGFDPETRVLTGLYENYSGWDETTGEPRFSCIFYLRGVIAGDPPYAVETWYPETWPEEIIAGQIEAMTSDEDFLLGIRLDEEHGGCWNVESFAGDEGVDFILEEPTDWREIRVIAADQAYLHETPEDSARTDFWLGRGVAIGVLETQPGWVLTEEELEGHTVQGWIKTDELFLATPR
jgi:hypothetical protein